MKNIKGFENYIISDSGKIVNTKTGRVLKQFLNPKGYSQIQLSTNGLSKTISIHRCVWETYKSVIPKGLEINHIDGVKTNNNISNLELVTHAENVQKAVETGLIKSGVNCLLSVGVDQIDVITKEVVASFGSIRLAAKTTGIANSSICNVCSGKRITAGGFLWVYKKY